MKLIPSDKHVRGGLAIVIVLLAFIVVAVLGVFVVVYAQDKSEAARQVLTTALPLLGTWVGAVIAFYFAKDNLETAARTTRELLTVEQRLGVVPVVEAMLTTAQIQGLKRLKDEAKSDALVLAELIAEMRFNRMPVLDEKDRALLMIHKSTLAEFVSVQALKPGAPRVAGLTIGKFKSTDPELFGKLKAFAFVSRIANLADAKSKMEAQGENCADVFVTETGASTEPIIGWITNVEIAKRSRA